MIERGSSDVDAGQQPRRQDADYVFYELTRSICPECRRVADAHILLRDDKVYMRKRCPEHGQFESLVYGDAQAYTSSAKFNKPGTIPLQFSTSVERGCPYDCGLCPEHHQHACVGIIEVNSACNMACPLCFADAGAGFSLSLSEVERILEHEVGANVRFAIDHPAVRGINVQPAFHAGRYPAHSPLERATIPEVLRLMEAQSDGVFLASDFVPVPCCFPTCNAVTYAYVDGDTVTPLPRLLAVDDYLDYITNRAYPDGAEIKAALEGLWSSSAVSGSENATQQFALTCAACGIDGAADLRLLADSMFMIMLQDFMDPWTFNQKNLMKCCKEILLPDGKQIPFCAYNTLGYREQARAQLAARQQERSKEYKANVPYEPIPLTFHFE